MMKNYTLKFSLMALLAGFLFFAPTVQAQLYINEFMASNDAAFPGPQGDYPDWIEIYNAGSEAVNLAGYYMSDDLTDPEKMYMILDTYPDSVTVAAGGFIVFYANKLEESSVRNLNIKLSGDGESIGLWNPNQEFVDSLTYGPQVADVSYGRFLDGTDTWFSMENYTPGAANQHTTAIEENTNLAVLSTYPNPCNNILSVEVNLENRADVEVSIFNVSGQKCMQLSPENMEAGSSRIQLNTETLAPGMYLLSVRSAQSQYVTKFSVSR